MEYLSGIGKLLDKDGLRSIVEDMCGQRPSHVWIDAFLDRNPQVVLGKPSGIDPKRTQAFNRTTVNDYFQKLCDTLQEHGIPLEHIWNMDEKGCQRGEEGNCSRSANLELFTLVECISADGHSIPPGFVFAVKEFNPDWFVDDISVATSENGWTNDFLCTEWFKKTFIPHATSHKVSDAPILLIVDGHGSHITGEMRHLATQHNILLFRLPPHTTHKLQPLDVGIFGPVQTAWLSCCAKILYDTGEEIPRADIVKGYLDVRKGCFEEETIRKAFRKCDIHPLNVNVFTDVDFAPSENTSTVAHAPASHPLYDPWFLKKGHGSHIDDVVVRGLDAFVGTNGEDGQVLQGSEGERSAEYTRSGMENSTGVGAEMTVGVDKFAVMEGSSKEAETQGAKLDEEAECGDGRIGRGRTDDTQSGHGVEGFDLGEGQQRAVVQGMHGDEGMTERDRAKGTRISMSPTTFPRLRSQTIPPSTSPILTGPSQPFPMRAHTRHTRRHLEQAPKIDHRPKVMLLADMKRVEEKNRALEDEIQRKENERRKAEVHSQLMLNENEKLRKRLEARRKRHPRKNLVTEARILNGHEGIAEWEAQEAERLEEEGKKANARASKDARQQERQLNREEHAHTMQFSGVLADKAKEDLRDIAWAFGLLNLGFDSRSESARKRTVIQLESDIQTFLEAHSDVLKIDPRYAGLYKKRPRFDVAPHVQQEPPMQRLRFSPPHNLLH